MSRLTAALADRYRIERELGQGGMATVYLAEVRVARRERLFELSGYDGVFGVSTPDTTCPGTDSDS